MVMKNGVGIHHQNKKHLFVYFFTMDSFVAEKLVKLGIDDAYMSKMVHEYVARLVEDEDMEEEERREAISAYLSEVTVSHYNWSMFTV
jgi:predicted transcriptional regulator